MNKTDKPLTLEQLKQMNGQPVYVEDKHFPEFSGWGVMREDVCDSYHAVCFIEEYGKRWLAYAYPPARIDREKWGPCKECEEKLCENCQSIHLASWEKPCKECAGKSNWQPASKYCPWCGRPLTEEAWAELERRVFGE